jgi:hypothetical protein
MGDYAPSPANPVAPSQPSALDRRAGDGMRYDPPTVINPFSMAYLTSSTRLCN